MRKGLAAVGLVAGLSFACGRDGRDRDRGGDSGADSGAPAVDPTLHECAEVAPRTESGTIAGTVTEEERVVSAAWVAPDDPWGGVATFEVTAPAGDPNVVPGLTLAYDVLEGFGDVALPDDDLVTGAVAAQSGAAVEVAYEDVSWHPEITYPYDFAIAWTWERRADCYEPNDAPTDAKHVPTDTDLEAWMFSAVGPAQPGAEVDWYRFTLAEPADVTVTADGAGAAAIALEVFAPGADEATATAFSEETLALPDLPAGTWLLRAQPFASLGRFDEADEPVNAHLWEPYRLRIDVAR